MKKLQVRGIIVRMNSGKPREPLAERVIPLRKNKQKSWKKMSDDELIQYAQKFIDENDIRTRTRLSKVDPALRTILMRRKLYYKIKFQEYHKQREWRSLSDAQIIEHTKRFILKNRIKTRSELQEINGGLYAVLAKRNLMDRIGLNKKRRDWESMTNDEVVTYVRKVMDQKEIRNRRGLQKQDGSVYQVLYKRNLIEIVIPKANHNQKQERKYGESDNELIQYAQKFIEEKGITNSSELWKTERKLYMIIKKRNLMERIGLRTEVLRKEVPRKYKDEINEILLIKRREELMKLGKNDTDITRSLAPEFCMDAVAILGKIYKLTKKGKIEENPNKLRHNYWTKWENFEKEARNIIAKNNGILPTQNELCKQGYASFCGAANRFGGLMRVREKLSLPNLRKPFKTGKESLSIWENLEAELKEMIREYGDLPDSHKFTSIGRSDLSCAIRLHGGFFKVRERLGLKHRRKPTQKLKRGNEALSKWENLEPVLRAIIKENNDELPSGTKLRKEGKTDVLVAIERYHGGMKGVRQKIGLKLLRLYGEESLKYWPNLEKLLIKMIKEFDGLPSSNRLIEMGYQKVVIAINKHHGGISAVRRKLGLKQLQMSRKPLKVGEKSLRYWDNLESILIEIVKKHGKIPTIAELRELDHKDIIGAIQRYHGGFKKVREKLQQTEAFTSIKRQQYLTGLGEIIDALAEFRGEAA